MRCEVAIPWATCNGSISAMLSPCGSAVTTPRLFLIPLLRQPRLQALWRFCRGGSSTSCVICWRPGVAGILGSRATCNGSWSTLLSCGSAVTTPGLLLIQRLRQLRLQALWRCRRDWSSTSCVICWCPGVAGVLGAKATCNGSWSALLSPCGSAVATPGLFPIQRLRQLRLQAWWRFC